MRAAVFLNGDPEPPGFLREAAKGAGVVIAADGGARHALSAGVVPDLIVGDLDSLGEAQAREAEALGARLERHPARKDKMDGHLAVLAAKDLGTTELDLLCASGRGLGAVFAVPHLLLAAERLGMKAAVVARWGGAFVLDSGSRKVVGERGDGVSVFPFAGPAVGVTLEGFEYPLAEARLEHGDTLGFHNELVGREGSVSVEEGAVLVIHERKEAL